MAGVQITQEQLSAAMVGSCTDLPWRAGLDICGQIPKLQQLQ
jgi:hypothetical protein